MHREITMLKELVYARIDGVESNLHSFQEAITRVPTEVQKAIEGLRELTNERVRSIDERFHAREGFLASQFDAAREIAAEQIRSSNIAIGKSETAFARQIEQLSVLLNQQDKATNDKVYELRNRLTLIEGMSQGGVNRNVESRQGIATAISIIVAAVAVIGVVLTLVSRPPDRIEAGGVSFQRER
jgi:hypothetical protein